ncbi:MAG: hypothetical protein FJW34_03530 [Acidobacteria bacterium]|nr:hypothetical protein [Acidobacteriota bacterium]
MAASKAGDRMTPAGYARARGLNRSTVSRQIRAGVITLDPDGRLDPAAADGARAANLDPTRGGKRKAEASPERVRAEAESAGRTAQRLPAGASLATARREREILKAKREGLALEREAKALVAVQEVRDALDALFVRFRTRALAIPPRIAERLAAESRPAACHEILLNEIERALNELAKPAELGGAR